MDQPVKWVQYVSRGLSLYKTDMYYRGLREALKEKFNFNYDNILTYGIGQETSLYIGEKDLTAFADLIRDVCLDCLKLKKDPLEFLNQIQQDFIKASVNLNSRKHQTKEDLIAGLNEFIKESNKYQLVVWFPVLSENSFFPYAEKRLMEITKDKSAWETVATPFEPSILQEEYIELIKLKKDFSEEKLRKHREKYVWMSVRFVDNEPYSKEEIRKRLEEIKDPEAEFEKIKNDLKEKKEKFYDLMDSINACEEDRALFLAVNRMNLLRQTRDNGRRVAYYNAKPFFEKIMKRLNCDYDTLLSYIHEDVIKFIEKGQKITKNPAKEYIHMFKNGKFELITNNVQERLKKENIELLKGGDIKELKGVIANKGKVTGKVKIISLGDWQNDVGKVQKGDILIAVSTKPDYILAMQRASAFVTDEGGITAHASIVAREMNKPCITGTKISTKVFKDGDLVEVDADSGVVRKL